VDDKMIPMKIWKFIVADHDDGMKVESISEAVQVSTSAIYRLLKKKQKTDSWIVSLISARVISGFSATNDSIFANLSSVTSDCLPLF